jgi:hypothetical protein
MLQWRTVEDLLPNDQEEVLIKNKGEYQLAIFEKHHKRFKLRHEIRKNLVVDAEISWLRLSPPVSTQP